ncbi:hypothetical protein EVAR_8559_1 [Eumeta japonica]|uniref:Uncharacterized protein n=1 Tax=Eumeta variegata TaxID=151549 RepID=A0A4C1TXG1_EUMVA|nr:hypothetical protein EVAR_8559_1 [Eumeta japonica]
MDVNKESRFNALAQKFKYRSPLWISDSDISGSSGSNGSNISEPETGRGLCDSNDSIACRSSSSDSSESINNFLDTKRHAVQQDVRPSHKQSSNVLENGLLNDELAS